MNETKQRLAIAKACGLECPCSSENDCWSECWQSWFDHLPDYLHDLNACHEMEKALDGIQLGLYLYHLPGQSVGLETDRAKKICATAAERCEAFLRSKQLWKG